MPALLLGLMVLVWIVGWFGAATHRLTWGKYDVFLGCGGGGFTFGCVQTGKIGGFTSGSSARWYRNYDWHRVFGRIHFDTRRWQEIGYLHIQSPSLCLMTLVLPLAVGPLTAFRFRLWHYLAYTTVVSLQLAYFLR